MHAWPAEPSLGVLLLDLAAQQDGLESPGVEVPFFPLLVAVVGLGVLVFVAMGALKMPRPHLRREPRRRDAARPQPAAAPALEAAAPPPLAPVYKKAPIAILFPMIKPNYPDVWGVREKAVIVYRAEDRGLVGQRDIPGLSAVIADTPVPLVFYRGEARLERVFNAPQDVQVVVELKVKGERQLRRTTRTLRVVDYREEIAELFARFKEEAAQKIVPLRPDATAWEVHDALLDADPKLSAVALREVVASFEEAKFSNHPVGRSTYEKMLHALRVFKIIEV